MLLHIIVSLNTEMKLCWKRHNMVIIKNKFIIDFYKPILLDGYRNTILLVGYKSEQVIDDVKSYTLMIFGIRFLIYKDTK